MDQAQVDTEAEIGILKESESDYRDVAVEASNSAASALLEDIRRTCDMLKEFIECSDVLKVWDHTTCIQRYIDDLQNILYKLDPIVDEPVTALTEELYVMQYNSLMKRTGIIRHAVDAIDATLAIKPGEQLLQVGLGGAQDCDDDSELMRWDINAENEDGVLKLYLEGETVDGSQRVVRELHVQPNGHIEAARGTFVYNLTPGVREARRV